MKKTDFNRLSSHDGYALSTAVGIGKFHCRYHNQNIPVAMTHKNGYAGIEPNKVLFLTSHFPKREN